jgi:hypothetical protein
MAIQVGGLQTDLDSIDYEVALYTDVTSKELVVDTTNFKIKLTQIRNLTRDGIVLRTLYSKLKEIWKTDSALIKLPFPMDPITDEQFDFVNGWNFDKTVNTTTKMTVDDCAGTSGVPTITTLNNFRQALNGAGTVVGITSNYAVSGTGIAPGARVIAVVSDTELTLDTPNVGPVSGTLTFWSKVDYTYNLIRTGGWSVKNASGVSTEEWANIITLGQLGPERTTKSILTTATTTNSNVITLANTTGIVVGSFVAAPGVYLGTTVVEVINTTQIRVTRTVATLAIGVVVTIRPADRVWYQISDDVNVIPEEAVLHGAIDQSIQIYGDVSNGDFDYRTPAIGRVFTREQGYTYDVATLADIGISTLTYQTYRFSLTSESDALRITHSDAEISSNGIFPTSSPYADMTITWYDEPQPRVISGSTYFFNVIIDADTTATGLFGKATAEEIYEYVQWALRRRVGVDIDADSTVTRLGFTTRELLRFEGNNLYTIYDAIDGGVYIDHFKEQDINRIVFSDNTDRQFPYVSFGTITFDTNFANDGINSKYTLFYKQINNQRHAASFVGTCSGTTLTVTNIISDSLTVGDAIVGLQPNTVIVSQSSGSTGREGNYTVNIAQAVPDKNLFAYRGTSLAYGTDHAVIVKAFSSDLSGDGSHDIRGSLNGNINFVVYDYDWDSNLQCAWIPSNRYRIGDEFRHSIFPGFPATWYRVTTAYTSGSEFSEGIDGINAVITTGPSVVLVAIGRNNAQYFKQEGIVAKSNTNLIAATSNLERNYSGT